MPQPKFSSLCHLCLRSNLPCASGALHIQLSVCQSLFPALRMSVHLYVFYLPVFIQGCEETFWLAKPMQGSLNIPTLMPCVTQLRNHPHASVEACGNAMSELKKTRDEKLRDSQRWCLGSTSPGLTVSENIFNYSTWRIEKPKTEQRPFNT